MSLPQRGGMSVALEGIKKQLHPSGVQHRYFRTKRFVCLFLRLVCREWHTLRGARHFFGTSFYRYFAPMGHIGADMLKTMQLNTTT